MRTFLTSLLLLLLGAGSPLPVMAAGGAGIGAGQILFSSTEIRQLPALHLESQVNFRVSGVLADVTLTQSFTNQSGEWQHATYVLPLPETAAVYRMVMLVGDRVIRSVVKEKSEARAIFDRARQQGKKAALTKQVRANLFRQQVANIAPGELIKVEIRLLQQVDYDKGKFSLRFPMTLTPRFVPGKPVEAGTFKLGEHGWALPTDVVPDAHLLSPPMQKASDSVVNPIHISAQLDIGMQLKEISSAYHQVSVSRRDAQYQVGLVDGPVSMDRDFVLSWMPVVGESPKAALFREHIDGMDYVMLMVLPPAREYAVRALARDMVMVIDTSGSMEGTSIAQARAGLLRALQSLRPQDRFNLIEFNDATSTLFSSVSAADAGNLQLAEHWTRALQAGGGTHMAPALSQAMRFAADEDQRNLRHIIFITDGAVGNETALFQQLTSDIGTARLFPVGIGSAPNSYFMRRAARLGRGSHTHIGDVAEVEAQIGELFEKIDSPIATDIEVHWPGDAEAFPYRIPAIYQGEPLVIVARADNLAGEVRVSGVSAEAPWQQFLSLDGGRISSGIGKYWARQKIESLSDEGVFTGQPDKFKTEITSVALAHSLVSRFTSLVAVEEIISRPPEAALRSSAIANAQAKGQQMQVHYPRTATRAQQSLLLGMLLLLMLSAWIGYRRFTMTAI